MTVTRMSKLFLRTLREPPGDADLVSHQLLLRAGLITPLAAGIYCYTPVGWRVVRNIEQIIREEMDGAGAQELHLPALSPIELWEQTGRAATMGQVLFQVTDRREREFVLGPTHEEVVSFVAARTIQSYRDLPVTLYQIQTKFRDEARPRGGLLRVREFTMKDAYSFDASWEALDASYDAQFAAYKRIFARAGVPVVPVLADSGAIGGKDSQEFIFLTPDGEDTILLCDGCGYAANAEKALFRAPPPVEAAPEPMEPVETPGQKTIADLAAFLGIEPRQTMKAVFFRADGQPLVAAIRGDLDVNEVKLKNALKVTDLVAMDDAVVKAAGLVAGSASPVGLTNVRVVADPSVTEAANLVGGANVPDRHLRNVNYGRDWTASLVAEIGLGREGDACAQCDGGTLHEQRGIEMGHVFKLGTMYSEALGVEFLDLDGERRPAVMGCYGIGVERILAAAIEANHDKDGIIWPPQLAPYDVHVVALELKRPEVAETADKVAADLAAAGYAVLFDDRDDSPGAKFKDADLLGVPARITVGPRSLKQGGVEVRARAGGESSIVTPDKAVAAVAELSAAAGAAK